VDDRVAEPDRYSALYGVARAINATLDLDEVLHLVARNVTESVGVRACGIRKNAQRHKAIRDDFAFIQEYTFGLHPTDR